MSEWVGERQREQSLEDNMFISQCNRKISGCEGSLAASEVG